MIKDIEISISRNIYSDKEENLCLLKLFSYLKRKATKNKKKISSRDIDDLREKNSDNESDKTNYEKKLNYPSLRKEKSVICNNYNKSTNIITNNIKRTNTYNIKRDYETDNYYVVMNYQKYAMKKRDIS